MRAAFVLGAALICGLLSPAQEKPASNAPSVRVSAPNRVYQVSAQSICSVDFRNVRLIRERGWSARLKNGKYYRRDSSGFDSAALQGVHCFDTQDGVARYALLDTVWAYGGGSSNTECIEQVVTIRSGHPVVTQQFDSDCAALTAGATFDAKLTILTIRARTNDDSPHCCAQTLDVVTYVWEGDHFRERSVKRIPAVVKTSKDGLEEH